MTDSSGDVLRCCSSRTAPTPPIIAWSIFVWTVALETLDEVGLPERALAVEQRPVQARHQREQLAHPPGRRQRPVPHLVLEVELAVARSGPLAQRQ